MGRLEHPALEEYKNAFVQFMQCYPEEVQARPYAGACVVEYRDKYYKVYHVSDMIEYSEGFFEGPEGVMEIPQEIWIGSI